MYKVLEIDGRAANPDKINAGTPDSAAYEFVSHYSRREFPSGTKIVIENTKNGEQYEYKVEWIFGGDFVRCEVNRQ